MDMTQDHYNLLEAWNNNDNIDFSINDCTPSEIQSESISKIKGAGSGIELIGSSQSKKDKGRFNSDCTNCPPHYSYRHGRWYYGHGHNYGCEFGGNKEGTNW